MAKATRPKLSAHRPSVASAAAQAMSTKTRRLAVDLPDATHRELKAKAARAGMSIKEYVFELFKKDGIEVPT